MRGRGGGGGGQGPTLLGVFCLLSFARNGIIVVTTLYQDDHRGGFLCGDFLF